MKDIKEKLQKILFDCRKGCVESILSNIKKSKEELDRFIARPFTVEEAKKTSKELGITIDIIEETLNDWVRLKKQFTQEKEGEGQ